MKYIPEIWKQMSEKYAESYDAQMAPFMRFGFKKKKGEVAIPADMVRNMIRLAYEQGAEMALNMANEIDVEE